jgi:methyl-accepting chemotaxis protein
MTEVASLPKQKIPKEQLQPFFDRVGKQMDRITTGTIIGYFLLGVFLSFFFDTYFFAFIMGGVCLGVYFILVAYVPHTKLIRVVTGLLYWTFGIQYMLELQGLSEAKAAFFVAITMLLLYEDWKIIIPATVYTIATYIVLFVHQDSDFVRTYLHQIGHITPTSLFLNVFSLVFYSVLCMWLAKVKNAQTKRSAVSSAIMENQLKLVDINVDFADSISQGNLKADYKTNQIDKLGQSLLNMRNSLVSAAEREEREKFINIGLARIGEILRQHSENLELLCENVLEDIVRYMKANQGFLFVRENQGENNDHLRLMAARAWERKKFLTKNISIGEGLIGQSAIEKRTIFITQVPEEYITITSGLGEANPRCVVIVPLKAEDDVVGVVELASFKVWADYEVKFLEKVGESIASMIVTTRNNQKNKELLIKSNLLAEQMHAQEEEIRQNLEEMQATQEEMDRKNKDIERLLQGAYEKEAELQKQLDEIQLIRKENESQHAAIIEGMGKYRQTLTNILDQLPHKVFLKDSEGKLILVNTAVAEAHNSTIEELIGKSDFDFVDPETALQWREQELQIIKSGSETYFFNENFSGHERTYKSTKMAFFIPHLEQLGLLGIQTDITEIETMKQTLKSKGISI